MKEMNGKIRNMGKSMLCHQRLVQRKCQQNQEEKKEQL